MRNLPQFHGRHIRHDLAQRVAHALMFVDSGAVEPENRQGPNLRMAPTIGHPMARNISSDPTGMGRPCRDSPPQWLSHQVGTTLRMVPAPTSRHCRAACYAMGGSGSRTLATFSGRRRPTRPKSFCPSVTFSLFRMDSPGHSARNPRNLSGIPGQFYRRQLFVFSGKSGSPFLCSQADC